MRLTLGDVVSVPPTARLRVQRVRNVTYQPLAFVTLAESNRSGAVWLVSMSLVSKTQTFLEGCFRAIVGANNNATRRKILLSSGGEEYFYSNWYFNSAPGLNWAVNRAPYYQFPTGGLTHYNVSNVTTRVPCDGSNDCRTLCGQPSCHAEISAFHVHQDDPLVFSDGLRFLWRVGDSNARDPSDTRKCLAWPDDLSHDGMPLSAPQPTAVDAHVWIYEW